MKKLIALLAVITLTAFAWAGPSATVSSISQKELMEAINAKSAVILDVNGSNSYRSRHIPGAIDFLANKQDIAKLLPADKGTLIVAYCANENCGAYRAAAQAALALGYTNVKHFSPGIMGWVKSGAPVEKS